MKRFLRLFRCYTELELENAKLRQQSQDFDAYAEEAKQKLLEESAALRGEIERLKKKLEAANASQPARLRPKTASEFRQLVEAQ